MRILMISAEAPPLSRAGGLAEVLEALPRELRERGHEVSVVLPFYREIRENTLVATNDTGVTVDIRVGEENHVAEYLEGHTDDGVQLFFVRCDPLFDRPNLYAEHGQAYEDNATRFVFFNKAAIELARRLTPVPQILHSHDWAAALVPVFVQAHGLAFHTVLTIHRIEEQGSFWGLDFALTNLPQRYFSPRGLEFYGRLNFLKAGLIFADRITTVSEHHKRELLESERVAAGLGVVLREQSHKLSGILHGLDQHRWNPALDPNLPATFGEDSLAGKASCRDALLEQLTLAPAPEGPVFGMLTRIVVEKGFDILVPLLDRLLNDDVRLIILGEGDPAFETALASAARRYPARFVYRRQFDLRLAHLIEAGADMTLIPSRFEPSGLGAMASLRYGALPVAHAGGGIPEIVEDFDPGLDRGYGFLCYRYSAEAFWDAIKRAREIYRERTLWQKLMRRAMRRQFSWTASAERYERLYRELVGENEELAA